MRSIVKFSAPEHLLRADFAADPYTIVLWSGLDLISGQTLLVPSSPFKGSANSQISLTHT